MPGKLEKNVPKAGESITKSDPAFESALLDSLPINIALINGTGTILSVNERWRQFALENGGRPSSTGVGVNYLALKSIQKYARQQVQYVEAKSGIKSVISGKITTFQLEYEYRYPTHKCWEMTVTPLVRTKDSYLICHWDITDFKYTEKTQLAGELQLRDLFNTARDVAENNEKERKPEMQKNHLKSAQKQFEVFDGILPICSICKRVRIDDSYWEGIEKYLHDLTGVLFSHGICPQCVTRHYPDLDE